MAHNYKPQPAKGVVTMSEAQWRWLLIAAAVYLGTQIAIIVVINLVMVWLFQ